MRITAACLLFLLVATVCHAEERVVLVTNEYIPYVRTSTHEEGVVTEVIRAAFERVGVEVELQFRPWRRCALLVEQGEVFAAYPYTKTEKRNGYALFSDPLWHCRSIFFYLKGRFSHFDAKTLEDVRPYRIAGTSGNFYEEPFARERLTVDYAPGEASGIRKLWEMRSDLFAEDELVGWTLISRIFPDHKQMFGATRSSWNENDLALMVSRKYPDAESLLARFNAGLAVIRSDGTYKAIVDRCVKDAPVVR